MPIRTKNTLLKASLMALTLSAPFHANADRILGIFAGASTWQQEFKGFVSDEQASTPTQVDIENDLGIQDNNSNVIYVALEHPIPMLPNVQLKQTNIEISGANVLDRQIEYGGQTYNISSSIVSEADLSHTDATAYYQILDNIVSLDLGITARFFDGFVEIQNSGGSNTGRIEFDSPIPLLYVNARADLPFTGAYLSLAGNALGDGDNSFTDIQATVGWESNYGLGVEAGYRLLDLDLDDLDDVSADLEINGGFAGLIYHF